MRTKRTMKTMRPWVWRELVECCAGSGLRDVWVWVKGSAVWW